MSDRPRSAADWPNGAVHLVQVEVGHPRYEELIGPLRGDDELLAVMLSEAESRLDEEPGKQWFVAAVQQGDRWVAGAWACAVVRDGLLWCCNNYERPGFRGNGLYGLAYDLRHAVLVESCGLPAVTYIFVDPLQRHLDDGWRVTGEGDSNEPWAPSHHWFELRRG